MANIQIKTAAFEGPMDLLCHLIEKNEINIYDIPIALLADQYIEVINSFENEYGYRDMEAMSEFILMAATLIEIKSRMLLPQKTQELEEEGDPRDELVERLIEYKRYKEIAELFKTNEAVSSKMFFKSADKAIPIDIRGRRKVELNEILADLSLETLYKAFQETIIRRELKTDKIRSGFKAVQKDLFTIEEKSEQIINLLIIYKKISFKSIFSEDASKIEMIVTFLALLELIKRREVVIAQETEFSDIIIHKYRSG